MTNETEQLRRLVDAREKAVPGSWYVATGEGINIFTDIRDRSFSVARLSSWAEDTIPNARFVALAGSTDLSAILSRMERMEKALHYYADTHPVPNEGPWGVNSSDFGQRAREALK